MTPSRERPAPMEDRPSIREAGLSTQGLVVLINGVVAGVGCLYGVSGSIAVTGVGASLAAVLGLGWMICGRRGIRS